MRFLLPAVFGLTVALALPAFAGITVTGAAGDVSVDASGAALSEIVSQISDKTGVTIELQGDRDPQIDGAFRGDVETVLTEMLRNTSFLITSLDDGRTGLKVILYDTGGAPPPPAAPVGQPGAPDNL